MFKICMRITADVSSLFSLENISHNKNIIEYSSNLICYIYNSHFTSSCNYTSWVLSILWMPLEEWSRMDTNSHLLLPSPNLMVIELLGLQINSACPQIWPAWNATCFTCSTRVALDRGMFSISLFHEENMCVHASLTLFIAGVLL